MAFHVSCWETATGRTANRKLPAKYSSRCETCGVMIERGDMLTWNNRSSKGTRAPETNTTPHEDSHDMTNDATSPAPAGIFGINLRALATALKSDLEEILDIPETGNGINVQVQQIEVKRPDGSTEDLGLQHRDFPKLLAICATRLNAWVAGPAGSGKTSAGKAVAKALGVEFYYTGAVTDVFALFGFIDASGTYRPTAFRQAYEHGGVFCFDEVDGSDPNAATAFQAAIENGVAAFPDGMIKRHPDCVIIATANTWGHGATHEYVGRNKLDAAFLDRFVRLEWNYDEDLEAATGPNMAWTQRVQQVRKAVKAKGLRVLVTPRATYNGAKLLAAGLDQGTVEAMTLAAAMTPDQWASVK